jgi:hypothetical protein
MGCMLMKIIQFFLSILALITLGACTLQMPAVETPSAVPAVTEIPTVAVTTPEEASPAALPTSTEAAPPPTAAAQKAVPTKAKSTATQTPWVTLGPPTATKVASTATPTPVTGFDPYKTYGKPKYQNPMQFANLAEWVQAETKDLPDNSDIRLQFKDGRLYVTGKRPDFSTWWFSYHSLGDAYVEMTFDNENCSGEDAYGIIFRGPQHLAGISYGYVASFTCNGKLWVFRLDGINPWEAETLVDEVKMGAINKGPNAQNVLGVYAVGDQFIIFANGTQVAKVQDDELRQGRVGVFVRPAGSGAYTYRVTNFAYWLLGK